jgi:hypothetical protein
MTERKAKPKARSASAARKPARKTATPSRPPKRPAPATAKKTSTEQASGDAASQRIDQRIRELGGWRGETLARMRALIQEAVPEVLEEVKWRGTPVWSLHGILCTGESYTKAVKLTFAQGARLPDPSGLFNASLDGNTRRAIDIPEGATVNARAFKALVKAAVALNGASKKKARPTASKARPVKLLSGGNPQIAKGDGDAPVQAYIAAMPGWKRDVGQRLDALIARSVPHVRKAVKWNSPFYGVEQGSWFLSFHCFARYVKVAFFRGASLDPVPPVASKSRETRYLHVGEGGFDEAQFAAWVEQASRLPGERM